MKIFNSFELKVFLVAGLLSISMNAVGAITLYNPAWKKEPGVMAGWTLIDKKSGVLSNLQKKDVFILTTDGINDALFWFKKRPHSWEPVILINVPTKEHRSFGVKSSNLRLFINGQMLGYGVEGSEAIFLFKWNKKKESFDIFYPNK